jgi:hypothetical protein
LSFEGLRDRNKCHVVLVESLDQPREIHQRATEPIDFVNNNNVNPIGLDVGKQPLQRWTFKRTAGKPTVVIVIGIPGK